MIARHRKMVEKLAGKPPPSGETDAKKFKLYPTRCLASPNSPHHIEVTVRVKQTYIDEMRRKYLTFASNPDNRFATPPMPFNWYESPRVERERERLKIENRVKVLVMTSAHTYIHFEPA